MQGSQATESQPVAPQTGATPSLALGSVILGCLAFVLSLIPCVGLVGTPLAVVGLMLGVVSLVMAARRRGIGVGYSIAGVTMNLMAIAVAVWLTSFLSRGAEAVSQALSQHSALEVQPPTEEENRYAREHLQILQTRVSCSGGFLSKRRASVHGSLLNQGSQSVDVVKLAVTFLDHEGRSVHEENTYAVMAYGPKMWFLRDVQDVLGPGATRDFKAGPISNPKGWQEGSIRVEIIELRLARDAR